MDTKSIIYLKSGQLLDCIDTAETITNSSIAWVATWWVSVNLRMWLRTGELKICKMNLVRSDISWIVDFENWELIMPPVPELPEMPEEVKLPEGVELEPRQKMTREEMDRIFEDRTWKKPHHKKSNKQVRELLNSLPEDIDATELWSDI